MARPRAFISEAVRGRSQQASSVSWLILAVCLTAISSAIYYTDYSPLIPAMHTELHISSEQAGLFSTLFFLGLAAAYIPAGLLIDRYGARFVLLISTFVFAVGGLLLPLFPNVTWLLAWRLITGIGVGGAFIAGAGVAAGLGKAAPLGQGLYGGSVQVGSGLGLLVTPLFPSWLGWRGAFLLWGLPGFISLTAWFFINDGAETKRATKLNLGSGLRSPAVWTLGLSHMGTFGLGYALAPWFALYLVQQYGLSLSLAAMLGSIVLLAGMFFRPLGGILIGRRIIGAIPLLRLGTCMGFLGVLLLILPLHLPIVTIGGLALIAFGATAPYTSVFNEAASLRDVSKGVAQSLASIISIPAVLLGPPLIGFLLDRTGSYTPAFDIILPLSLVAITASMLAGPAVAREKREISL